MSTEGRGSKGSGLRAEEVSCYASALRRVIERYGALHPLPPGALHHIGGLRQETAAAVEVVIQSLAQREPTQPSLALVMAEIDQQIER